MLGRHFRRWPITSTAQFDPGPLLVEPDIGDLRHLLLDHLIGSGQQRFRDGEAERLGGFQIDGQFDLRGLLYRQDAPHHKRRFIGVFLRAPDLGLTWAQQIARLMAFHRRAPLGAPNPDTVWRGIVGRPGSIATSPAIGSPDQP